MATPVEASDVVRRRGDLLMTLARWSIASTLCGRRHPDMVVDLAGINDVHPGRGQLDTDGCQAQYVHIPPLNA
jgi:hypothetical protein